MTNSLGRRIKELGLSYTDAADRFAEFTDHEYRPDPSLVWRWANDETVPDGSTIEVLIEAFDLDPDVYHAELMRIREARVAERQERRAAGRRAEAPARDLEDSWSELSRRDLVLGGAGTIADVMVSNAARRIAWAAGRSDLGGEKLTALGHLIQGITASYSRLPLTAVEASLEELLSDIAADFERTMTHRQRRELHHRGAQICALLGRVTSATGRGQVARFHYSTAFSLSREIGDRRMQEWLALEKATMLCEAGAPREALDLARAALRSSTGSDRVQANALIARAAAQMSDTTQARNAIGRAEKDVSAIEEAYDSDRTDAVFHAWAASCTFHALGRAALDLGDREACRSLAQEAMRAALESTSMWRKQNVAHARLVEAGAAALDGDPVRSTTLVGEVLDSDPQAMFLMRTQASSVLARLSPYETTAAVRELRERIRASN